MPPGQFQSNHAGSNSYNVKWSWVNFFLEGDWVWSAERCVFSQDLTDLIVVSKADSQNGHCPIWTITVNDGPALPTVSPTGSSVAQRTTNKIASPPPRRTSTASSALSIDSHLKCCIRLQRYNRMPTLIHFRQPQIFDPFQQPFCNWNPASISVDLDNDRIIPFPSTSRGSFTTGGRWIVTQLKHLSRLLSPSPTSSYSALWAVLDASADPC